MAPLWRVDEAPLEGPETSEADAEALRTLEEQRNGT